MITDKNRLLNRLLGAIYIDKTDSTVFRINTNHALSILFGQDIILPVQVYEEKLQQALDYHLVGKAGVNQVTKFAIANIMYELAQKLRIDKSKLEDYITYLEENEDFSSIPKEIDEWRRETYGRMTPTERNALADTLVNKLRPDVLDKIRNPDFLSE